MHKQYGGVVFDEEEGLAIAQTLGNKKVHHPVDASHVEGQTLTELAIGRYPAGLSSSSP